MLEIGINKEPNKEPVVTLQGFAPEKKSLVLLQSLENCGILSPVLFSGAVRDDYFRQLHLKNKNIPFVHTNDYDIRAGLDVERILGTAKDSETATRNFENYFKKNFSGLKILKSEIYMTQDGNFCSGFFTYEYKGLLVSLMLDNDELKVPSLTKRVRGYAPISFIGMDASGKVIAHKYFERDVENLVWRPIDPDNPDEKKKFDQLCEKIKKLTRVENDGPSHPQKKPANIANSRGHCI